jgi:large subunit ribosomal protein L24
MRKVITAKTRLFIRHGDMVKILTGRDKGKSGKVLHVDPAKGRVKVEHVAIMKRHTRANPSKNIKGGILEKEAAIAVSNVMLICPGCGKASRVGHTKLQDGSSARSCKRCNATFEN